jgi:ribosomal-protein-alanine N-acetyltransferase
MNADNTVTLRPMRSDDLPSVQEIEAACYPDPWPETGFSSELESTAPPVVAEVGGHTVGYLCRMLGPQELHITNIAVHSEFRRNGIARRLLQDTVEFAAQHNCLWIYLDVRPSNVAARTLYERFGFVEIFRRKKYYNTPPEDGLVMARPVDMSRPGQERPPASETKIGKHDHGMV